MPHGKERAHEAESGGDQDHPAAPRPDAARHIGRRTHTREEIRASFYADPAREIFPGHFPGNPVLPGVYTVECLGQAADLVVMTTERYAGKTPLLIGVDKARFTRKVRPGETLELRARLIHERAEKAIVTCAAEAYVEGELALSCEITLALR